MIALRERLMVEGVLRLRQPVRFALRLTSLSMTLFPESSANENGRLGRPLVKGTRELSVEAEAYFHVNLNGYRFAVFHGRFELPALYRFDGFLVETQA